MVARHAALLAAGHALSLTELQGRLLVSTDRGTSWREAALEPLAGDTSLQVLRLSGADGTPALYASGFRQGANLAAQIAGSGSRLPAHLK